MKFIIVGFGYWGKNFLKFFNENTSLELVGIVDIVKPDMPIKHFSSIEDLKLSKIDFDAAIIATPTSTHYEIVKKMLKMNKHIFCEKPLTNSYKTTFELIEEANQKKLILHTNFLYLYNSGILKISELINESKLGNLKYISFERTGLGPIRSDVNALWDLASHDISILNILTKDKIDKIFASGKKDLSTQQEGIINTSIFFNSGLYANIFSSWMHPQKTRVIKIVGDKKMIVFDDLSPVERVKIFDKTIDNFEVKNLAINTSITNLTAGDILIPDINFSEPLKILLILFKK